MATGGRKEATGRTADADGPDTGAVKRGRGSTAVYEELREDILSLRMAQGSALDEVALAARFGLSRTPIREALLMLQREDLVTFLPGRSAIVTPHTMSNAHEYMDTLMLLSRAIIRLAAEMRTPETLERIRACNAEYAAVAAAGEVDAIVAADLAFHNAISAASGNTFLGSFYRLALDYGRRMHLLHYYPLFDADEAARCVGQHAAMLAAIEAGDPARSEELASDHVMSELRVVQRSLEPKVGIKFSLGNGTGSGR
ncbi:GntR family transcriptional regulator [Aquibium sp. ELW1220]|uniref:GntR family transcriptional regulator n=1 Tax=Aquibium sp. ELW1220 TaxID=2976766 RepID=UPI0025B1F88C|nr:GntR family transcriptional regulator [Aquibium sp. ELW1220]MDN2583814.1 GntR family transcriptional regulator [Aquibium sp. ELW1220]